MQYSRPMIELVYEIRRRVNSELKPSIKLSNPELLHELREHYLKTNCTIAKTLIKELFSLAGSPWNTLLENSKKKTNKQVTKVYRGQVSLEDAPSTKQGDAPPKKPVKIYRGQIVR